MEKPDIFIAEVVNSILKMSPYQITISLYIIIPRPGLLYA
jgi:hypothetical protein